jgi:hypothetical protein
MPRPKPSVLTGTADLNATIERVAPAILALLADGVPRREATIVETLTGRYAEDDATLAPIRLAVTERARETGGKSMMETATGV